MENFLSIGYPLPRRNSPPAVTNPYDPDQPAGHTTFRGREEALSWLRRRLVAYQPAQPPFIHGPAGIGKTSLLQHLAGRPNDTHQFAYISVTQLPFSSLEEFLYALAAAAIRDLQRQQIRLTPIPRRTFMATPRRAFSRYFIEPVLSALHGRHLVLLLDDCRPLFGPDKAAAVIREHLYRLTEQQHRVRLVFASASPEPAGNYLPFDNRHNYDLTPLDRAAALRLIQEPVPYKLFRSVADYIYATAAGHPRQLQAICHALFERWQRNRPAHVTVTDVVTAMRQHLPPATQEMLHLPRPVPAPPFAHHNGQRAQRPALSRPYTILAALLLLLLAAILLPQLDRPDALPLVAGPLTPEPTNTRLPTATPGAAQAIAATPTRPPRASATAFLATATATLSPTVTLPDTPTSAAPPTLIIREADNMPLLLVPAGTFGMGSSSDRPEVSSDEMPEHPVTLDAFYMDQYEVSVSQFAAFLNAMPPDYQRSCIGLGCYFSRLRIGTTSYLLEEEREDGRVGFRAMSGYENYPINHVSWFAARDYCAAVGGRLPTEAEWEYAARGTDGRLYPWGNEPPDLTRAVFASLSFSDLKPVDALPAGASPFGIFGLAGSMWEWVADYYSPTYYAESPQHNPPGPADGPGRVTRGGGWPNNNHSDRVRAINRNWLEPDYLSADLGFRCVVPLAPSN